jgi:hypothetical protein
VRFVHWAALHQFDGSFEMGIKMQADDRLGAFAQNPFHQIAPKSLAHWGSLWPMSLPTTDKGKQRP